MSKHPANSIFPAKVKKSIFYSYIQYASIRGWAFIDVAGKPYSQISMLGMFSTNIHLLVEYIVNEYPKYEEIFIDVQNESTYKQCVSILENIDLFGEYSDDPPIYGGLDTEAVIAFIPKYIEIMDILEAGGEYKGLRYTR